jgi:general nucleoside transport system permease protein
VVLVSFLGSGALAGLAGGVEVAGLTFALYEGLSPGWGYTAIAVALLAGLEPLAVVGTGVLFGALEAGAGAMQRDAGIPAVWVIAVQALIILSVSRSTSSEAPLELGRLGTVEQPSRLGPTHRLPTPGRRRHVTELELVLFLEASVRLGAPLALAAMGETITERSGVINIGLEGSLIAGALGGALGALAFGAAGPGVLAGAAAGLAVAAVFGALSVGLGTDQIITGTAVTLGGLGLTGAIYQARFGATGTALTLPTLAPARVPVLADVPWVGSALFAQAPTAYLAYGLAPLLWYFLFRTEWGLELRAVGEQPDAAEAAGVRVRWVRLWATLFGGALAGIAGAHLALAHVGTFAENMSAGRGFIAIAVVVLGRWNPLLVLLAAVFFGAASALQFFLQAVGLDLPYQLFLALPYVLTLAALAGWVGRARAPAALAQAWPRER